MNIRTRRNPIQKALKDYMVPIIGGILILILIFSMFSGGNNTQDEVISNEVGYSIKFDSENTEAYIEKLSGKKDKITNNAEFYKGEIIKVKKGSISLLIDNVANFKLSSSGILEYKKDGSLKLTSGNLWIESISNFTLNTTFGKIKLIDGAVVNVAQYDTSLTLYDFTGKAEIENNAGISTILSKGEEISIGTLQASDSESDLGLLKTNINDNFKGSPWYIRNGGDELLTLIESPKSASGSVSTLNKNISGLINFDNLNDELYISESNLDITGTYDSEKVGKITINGYEMNLNSEESIFSYDKFLMNKSENDLIIKIYDKDNALLSKKLITVYNSNVSSNSSSNRGFKVTTFDIDASRIKFTAPSTTGTYTTTSTEVTIKGSTPANTFSYITVNDYRLKSYNGTTWKYHAFTRFDNLDIGKTNRYVVNYYGENGDILYTNYFTIIQEDPKKNIKKPVAPSSYSNEAKLN